MASHSGRPDCPAAPRNAALGALLLDPERIYDIAPLLAPEDFFDPVHQVVYRAIEKLYEDRSPIDFVTVASRLQGDETIEQLGGSSFLATFTESVPTASHAEHYARIIKAASLRRAIARAGRQIEALAAERDLELSVLQDRAEAMLLAASRSCSDSPTQSIAELAGETFDRYATLQETEDKTAITGVGTGFPSLDRLITGLAPGNLIVLSGRPSMGKTSLALDIAFHAAARKGKNVAIFSLEMSKEELMDRIVAGVLGVETWRLKKGMLGKEDFDRLGHVFDGLKGHPNDFVILCRSREEAERALEVVRRWVEDSGLVLHPTKTKIVDARSQGFEFLGYHFRGELRLPRKKSLTKLKETVRARTRRTNAHSLPCLCATLSKTLRGWFTYFRHCHRNVFTGLDGWIRMRLRSILRRRSGRRGRGRGADHQRWPNSYFADHGLFSLGQTHARFCQSPMG